MLISTSENKDVKSRSYVVDKMHKEAGERDEKFKEVEKKVKDLEVKSIDLENKNFDFNTKFESFTLNYQMHLRSVGSIKERLDELEEIREKENVEFKKLEEKLSGGNDGVDKKDFEKLLERVNGNDSLIDGLIGKVKKITGDMKLKTPAFAKPEDSIEEKIKQMERMITKINEEMGKAHGDKDIALDFDIENRLKVVEKEIDDIKSTVPVNTAASNDGTTHSSINYNLKKKIDNISKDNQEMKSALIS